jgi:hypothetical protein
MPSSLSGLSPLLLLLLAVVVGFADGLDVLGIPEQDGVTAMPDLVVSDWAVVGRVLTDAEHARLLAPVVIASPDLTSQFLPALSAIPASPLDVLVSLLEPGLLVTRRSTQPRRESAYPWRHGLQLAHIPRRNKARLITGLGSLIWS